MGIILSAIAVSSFVRIGYRNKLDAPDARTVRTHYSGIVSKESRMPTSLLRLTAVLLAVSAWPAAAHRLLEITDTPMGPDNALVVDDIAVSQVGYHTAGPAAPTHWMTFQAEAGAMLHFETGVPYIARYSDLRPSVALVGPGLPQASLPFAIPEGLGAVIYSSDAIEAPVVFDEQFTGTQSWTYGPYMRVLPETGRYYLVTYLPDLGAGKFWTAVGKAERFGVSDILTLPQTIVGVRTYHEIFPLGGLLFWGMVAAAAVIVSLLASFFTQAAA
jgi:hypothetical protein